MGEKRNHDSALSDTARAPLFARSMAVSLPIPVLAPVMTTVFPSSFASEDQAARKRFLQNWEISENVLNGDKKGSFLWLKTKNYDFKKRQKNKTPENYDF